MRVFHFFGTIRPGHDGVVRYLYKVREGLTNKYHHNDLYLSPTTPEPPYEDQRKVPSLVFLPNPDYRISIASVGEIERILDNQKPDIVHINSPCTLGHAAVRFAKKKNVPVVATYHTHFPSYMPYYHIQPLTGLSWKILRKLYGQCEKVIVSATSIIEELHSHGITNTVQISPGVETEKFSPSKRSEDFRKQIGADDKVVVSFASRLVWEKNLKFFVEVWNKLKHADKAKLVFIGDGAAREKLSRWLPEAYFTGFLNDTKLPTAYASSDVFAFPSVTETFGLVTVEALASGVPALCAKEGGASEPVQPDINGMLASGFNSNEFASKLDELIESESLRKKLKEGTLESVKRFNWNNTIDKFEQLYQSLV